VRVSVCVCVRERERERERERDPAHWYMDTPMWRVDLETSRESARARARIQTRLQCVKEEEEEVLCRSEDVNVDVSHQEGSS
jgi:hypothetical protein